MAGSTTSKTLRIVLEATGAAAAARQITAVDKAVGNLGKQHATLSKFGAGVGNVVRNSVILGTVAAGAVAGYMAIAIRDGQEAARVQKVLDTAIANSGKVSRAQATAIQAQSQSLMMLAGVDDETIKAEQTRLVQMGLTGDQVLKLTPLIMDMSKATGRDLLSSTLAVGKAVNGTTTGLQRFGIFVDKAKAKTDPFGATVDALNAKFGGTTQALSGTFETRLAAFRIGIGEIGEDIGIRLLPALTRMADVAGRVVVPAFAKFVDRVMPDVERGFGQFATLLENGGAQKAIDGIYTSVSALVDLLRIAAGPVKMIVGAFMALPKEVQTVLVAGFAVNKLSGGMFGSVVGDVAKNALKGILNVTAATATVKAGVVTVTGPTAGLPGAGGGPSIPPAAAAPGLIGAGAVGAVGAAALATTLISSANLVGSTTQTQRIGDQLPGSGTRGRVYGMTNPAALQTANLGGAREYFRGQGVNIAPITSGLGAIQREVASLRSAMRVNVNVAFSVSEVQRQIIIKRATTRGAGTSSKGGFYAGPGL